SDQENAGEAAANAIDGDPDTIWHSRWRPDKPAHPHMIAIDFGEALSLKGFSYLPRGEDHKTGCILGYKLEASEDGRAWETASEGEFQNMTNNPAYREVSFGKTYKARYMRLVSTSAINNSPHASAAEIGVITK
ncbi:MAG: discoidin domain-containing protein, partial [Pseudomonadales bacterium]|nr:discoidin domain-containing protein [Pseudomonadales bacterium]